MKNIFEGVSDDSRYCMEKLRLSLNPQERPDKVSERSVHSYSADLGDGILRNRCEWSVLLRFSAHLSSGRAWCDHERTPYSTARSKGQKNLTLWWVGPSHVVLDIVDMTHGTRLVGLELRCCPWRSKIFLLDHIQPSRQDIPADHHGAGNLGSPWPNSPFRLPIPLEEGNHQWDQALWREERLGNDKAWEGKRVVDPILCREY